MIWEGFMNAYEFELKEGDDLIVIGEDVGEAERILAAHLGQTDQWERVRPLGRVIIEARGKPSRRGCVFDNCGYVALPGSEYCDQHKGQRPEVDVFRGELLDCAKKDCPNVALPRSNYCEHHRPGGP